MSETTDPVVVASLGDDTCYGRCVDLLDWFAWECRGLLLPEESHNVLDLLLNRLAVPSSWPTYPAARSTRTGNPYWRTETTMETTEAGYRPGDRVEWNPTGDEWKSATVLRLNGSHYLIVLHENGQALHVRPEHLRFAEPQCETVASVQADRDRLAAEIAELHTWRGLMSLLDEYWPADVFDGSSNDPGARIVVLMRQVDLLRRQVPDLEVDSYRRPSATISGESCPDCGDDGPHSPVPGKPGRVECGAGGCGASWELDPVVGSSSGGGDDGR